MGDAFLIEGGVVNHVEEYVVDEDDDERREESIPEVAPPGSVVLHSLSGI